MQALVRPAQGLRAGLSGYLCGTHSGLLAIRRPSPLRQNYDPETLAATHRRFTPVPEADDSLQIGRDRWKPNERQDLADSLDHALAQDPVIDLVFFGSQARGGRTGFSDVDAILVIDDETAESATRLRALRPRILAAQRAVLAYQPMQHHGFEVVTPKLLIEAGAALALPAIALSQTCSLNGTGIAARFGDLHFDRGAFDALATSLGRLHSWSAHPWEAHRQVSMFELLPTLYVQGRDLTIPKWRSFQEVRGEFDKDWWPYEVLADVREAWPRLRRPILEGAADVARNPWIAVALWRRLPVALVPPAGLTPRLLEGLQGLARLMMERRR
jgi:hypothetical protein